MEIRKRDLADFAFGDVTSIASEGKPVLLKQGGRWFGFWPDKGRIDAGKMGCFVKALEEFRQTVAVIIEVEDNLCLVDSAGQPLGLFMPIDNAYLAGTKMSPEQAVLFIEKHFVRHVAGLYKIAATVRSHDRNAKRKKTRVKA